ncbi:HtaA domain-containing protein [Protaetiibacter larvae]|uniref:HtaA domain-containing protein n=1 Tax=Protaetiibacter larvae TaxID=2592654 RepID=UPI00143D11CA|nr:HtaA domain-containing protein [Protaetiibacter larvae]
MSYAPDRARSRAPWIAFLLVPLLALAGLLVPASAASAAPGDVAGATLNWGFKASFRNYLNGPIAHGHATGSGVDTATPYGWSGGTGSATGGTGTVGYPGTLQFQGHEATGVPAGEYALDVTVTDVRVRVTSATTAELQADVVSRSMTTLAFENYPDVVLATLDLSAGTNASTASTLAYTGVPAVLTAAGAPAFAGFYAAGAALDPVSFSWPVEQAPVVPTLSVSQTAGLDPAGATITVTGENYDPDFVARGATAGFYAQIGWIDSTWRPSQGAVSANRSNAYSAWVQDVNTASPYLKWTENGDGTVDFSWTITITKAALDAKSRPGATLAVFTVGAGGVVQAGNELAVPIAFYDTTTRLDVDTTSGLDPAGATITVTGTNYDPDFVARGATAGFYAQVGWIDSTWRPSEGAVSGNRSNAYSAWVQDVNTAAPYLKWTENAYGSVDFSWTISITKAALDAKSRAGATLAVFTVGAGGVVQAGNELAVPIAFYDTTTTLTVDATSGLDPAGATITVTGKNYNPDYTARGSAAGFYAQVGWIDSTWRPSQGAVSGNRSNAYSAWVQGINETAPYLKWTENAYGTVDFSWTIPITKAALDAKTRAGATLAVFTVGAGGVVQADNELAVPIAFQTPTDPGTGGPGTTPTPAAGTLSWGVKASFRDYVTGPIAHGSITTSGVATAGGRYVFPQSGAASLTDGLGSVSYSGSVHFSGHAGVLDLRLSDPQVRIDSATSGTLLVRVDGGTRVAFASLALGSGTRSTGADGSVSFTGVPATITATGSDAFAFEGSSFYPAGTALDPVSFTIGSAGSSLGGTTVVAAARTTPANTPDAAPPATEGITLDGDGEVTEGGEVTARADGFQPNETGILVVIYSTPTVLAENATADADGRVSWTGSLPRGLTGEHTLTFQGSVDRGVVLDIRAAATLQCTVSDAQLVWGFKESFRAYIDGSIANGEWTTDGDASYDTPVFTWAGGSGSADPEAGGLDVAYGGSVRFTGHGGVLDTTIANPHVVIDGDRAVLLLDITGTTQEGTPVSSTGVEFAELDLTGVEASREGDTLSWTDVPASLTAAGAAAFGTYPEGEALDPVTISATVESGCGAVAEASDEPSEEAIAPEEASDAAGWPLWATILIAVVVLLLIAALVIVLVRRGRKGTPAA